MRGSPLVTDQRRDAATVTPLVGPPGHGPGWSGAIPLRFPDHLL